MSSLSSDRRPKRPDCTDPTHEWRLVGARQMRRCVTCHLAYQKAYQKRVREQRVRDQAMPLPAGVSERSNRSRKIWEARRAKATPEQISDQIRSGQQRRKAIMGEWRQPPPVTRKGLVEFRGGFVDRAVHDAFCITEHAHLRGVMIAAHPDKGGTSRRFIVARKALLAFEDAERRWYAQYGLTVPACLERKQRAA